MVETMHNVVLRTTQNVMQKFLFIFVNCDEVTTIENQSWLSIHVYVIEEWKRVLILLNLQHVVDGTTFDNLTALIGKNLMEFRGLSETNLANKLVCSRVDGVIVFQGVKSVIIPQIMRKHAPFVNGVHYMPHCTNLAIQTLSVLSSVSKIENLLAFMYNYFVHSLKPHLDIIKLVEIFE